jgi:hypothetical protein
MNIFAVIFITGIVICMLLSIIAPCFDIDLDRELRKFFKQIKKGVKK